MLAPVCKDLSCRIYIIEAVLRDECESEEEAGADVGGIGPPAHNELAVNAARPFAYCIDDEPNLMRYFKKLVRDEVSSCSSVHALPDPNLMQPSHFNTSETLQDCRF